ncbi:hypothetical protein V2J09_021204 [Rumex salicifolius]
MDDFGVALGMDGIRRFNRVPMPYLNFVVVIKAIDERVQESGADILGHNEFNECYDQEEVPEEIDVVLKENEDMMPKKLLPTLPPQREMDHQIYALPPAKVPYRMPPPELEELRRQLDELLGVGFVRPSKAFEEYTDASDFAIGWVLILHRHPIAFERGS